MVFRSHRQAYLSVERGGAHCAVLNPGSVTCEETMKLLEQTVAFIDSFSGLEIKFNIFLTCVLLHFGDV